MTPLLIFYFILVSLLLYFFLLFEESSVKEKRETLKELFLWKVPTNFFQDPWFHWVNDYIDYGKIKRTLKFELPEKNESKPCVKTPVNPVAW